MLKLNWFVVIIAMLIANSTLAQTNVEIVGGEKLSVDQKLNYTYIVDNVIIKHNGVIIQCDSAIRKGDEGIIEGFGHIYIYQPDTFTLSGGEYLKYTEATRTANVTGKHVILKDDNMTLLTSSLNYNIVNQVGFYTNGADILSSENTLKSRRGYYNRRSNIFNFKDEVKLNGEDFSMTGDTLDYFAFSKTAYFYGPSRIISQENIIDCNYGWYNTQTEKALFSKGASMHSKTTSIFADSLIYNKKIGLGRGIGNIKLIDSTEEMTVYGQYGWYNQKTALSMVTNNPMAMQLKDGDTMMILADTFYYSNDSLNRILKGIGNTNVYNKDMQGKCDSMVYNFKDSVISLFKAPILWSEKNQITGDTIFIQLKSKKIDYMKVNGNSFLAGLVKTGHFNQISGKNMNIRFQDGKIHEVHVLGNASSIYYLRDNETDTAEYTGVNKVSCSRMLIYFDSSKVKGIKFYTQVEGKMYPIMEFPEAEKKLEGLNWVYDSRLQKEIYLERTKIVYPKPSKLNSEAIQAQVKKKPVKAKKK